MIKSRWILALGLITLLTACGDSGPASTESVQATEVEKPLSDSQTQPACELVMGWDPWEPYQYEIAGGQVFGLDVDLVKAVTNNTGCTLSFEKGNWRELLQGLRDGEIDLLAGATATSEREVFAHFTTPYRDEQFELFLAADRLDEVSEANLTDLLAEGWRIGVVEGYLYSDAITALQDDPGLADQFVYSAMAETNMAQLLEGAIDALIEDKYVGAAIIRHKNLQNDINSHTQGFARTEISIMVSRASVDESLFMRLDQSVEELRDNGAIDKLLARYAEP